MLSSNRRSDSLEWWQTVVVFSAISVASVVKISVPCLTTSATFSRTVALAWVRPWVWDRQPKEIKLQQKSKLVRVVLYLNGSSNNSSGYLLKDPVVIFMTIEPLSSSTTFIGLRELVPSRLELVRLTSALISPWMSGPWSSVVPWIYNQHSFKNKMKKMKACGRLESLNDHPRYNLYAVF